MEVKNMYEWVKNESRNPCATLYSTNITLNRSATELLESAWYVMLGIDKDGKRIAIRKVSQRDVNDGIVTKENLYKISIGRSYGRIANRSFCMLLDEIFELGLCIEAGRKFPVTYDSLEDMLIIDLSRGEIE
jgi:hypothetical protein